MAEDVFYEAPGVKVTNARFIVDNQTYAMNGVTSVKTLTIPPSYGGAIIAILIGLVLLFAGAAGVKVLGLAIAAFGIFLIVKAKAEHVVVLHSASGEAQALKSTDGQHIHDVIAALNDALVHRG
ncbi:DUF6232 family protein [Sphingomonas sp.]|jgi:hypothetical protein|uniref:DUF6232 family protein n=1 Tax=Sphingomonas sp. TaxID=28214 RepID=UPI002E34507C|nr:DUF6232 family protein [Sphingomonas sp.]HEX4693283.1 DUF6232 family protein [Sphingomonas sp.]